jgi:hypothetical protein
MAVEFDASAIPDELKERDQWLLWDASNDTPRQPHWRGDFGISWSNPSDWHSFEEAVEAANERDSWGIGYVMAGDNSDHPRGLYGCIDIDGGLREQHESKPKEWVPSLLDFLDDDAYIEYSPSGTGIHIPIVGHEAPQYWNDPDMDDGEHEGVDYLRNKFCTFTGDTIDGSGSEVTDVDPSEWLLKAYQEIEGELPRLESEKGTSEYDDDDLPEDDVVDALNELDPGMGHEEWVRLAYAVHSWDSSPTGKRVFENWSSSSSKYDDEAERQIEWIWENANADDGVSVGTLIHKAKQAGWSPPKPSSQQMPSTASSDVDDDEVERGEAILRAETTPESPAGELEFENGCYGYEWVNVDDDGNIIDRGFDEVTNFTLETLSYLDTYEGELITLEVNPNHPMEDEYEVEVHPTVFNEAREFREQVVRGRTTWFRPDAGNKSTMGVLSDIRETVGSQMAPKHQGTEHIGLHGSSYDEWVTPAGTMTADGWADEYDNKFYEKGGELDSSSSLVEKWALDPEDGSEYDEDTVAQICELLPWTRDPARGLPVLGWYYAAALKPLIYNEFGNGGAKQFNLLQVVGGTGTGKTSTLEMYYKLFGANPNPYGCGDKAFTIEKKLSSSRGLPIWLDEYKPTDLAPGKMDWLHRRLREVFRGQNISKGTATLGEITFRLQAPTVFSGEQIVGVPAVRRRTVITQFSSSSTKGEQREKFTELQRPEYDFHEHAHAFYRHILSTDTETLSEKWDAADETVHRFLDELGIDALSEDSELQGLTTIIFGYRVFESFAQEMGADVSKLPGEDELREAVAHVAGNVGPDGRRREHIDDFTELVAQASQHEYLEENVHYRVMESRKFETEALAFHMPTTFPAVKRYMQDYNLSDEYSLLGKNDYLDNYADKAEDASAYSLATNQKVRKVENGTKGVYIDIEAASDTLGEEFTKDAFTHAREEDGVTPLSALEAGMTADEVTVEIAQLYVEEKPWLSMEGWAVDSSEAVKLVVRDDLEHDFEEEQTYRLQNVHVTEDGGMVAIEPIPNITSISEIEPGTGTTPEDGVEWLNGTKADEIESSGQSEQAASDGGRVETEAPADEDPRPRIVHYVRDKQDEGEKNGVPHDQVVEYGYHNWGQTREKMVQFIEKLTQQGKLTEPSEDGLYRTR